MTDAIRKLNDLLNKTSDADMRSEMIGFEAKRLIDHSRAAATVFYLARQERNALLNWPSQVASFSDSTKKSVPSVFEMRQARTLRMCQSMMVIDKGDLAAWECRGYLCTKPDLAFSSAAPAAGYRLPRTRRRDSSSFPGRRRACRVRLRCCPAQGCRDRGRGADVPSW